MRKDRGGAGLTSPNSPTNPSGGDVAEGVSFDGVNDYLSRSTDLVGNVDSKTFTFSCWVYISSTITLGNAGIIGTITNTYSTLRLGVNYLNNLFIAMRDKDTNSYTLHTDTVDSLYNVPKDTFVHIAISIDSDNQSNCIISINDTVKSMSFTTFAAGSTLLSSTDLITTGAMDLTGLRGRLSNLFLDYTYRDLSIEANRRLFITADGKPA